MSLFQITSNSLQSNGVKIDRLIQFSDCAPSQYKNKTSFIDASFSEKDFGFRTEKHFFGSRHGKGPCDREIGVLKKKARLEVLSRNVNIRSAKELCSFGQHYLSKPNERSPVSDHARSKMSFTYVEKTSVQRRRSERTNVKTLPNTRSQFAIFGISPYIVGSKEHSCFCTGCMKGDDSCTKSHITGTMQITNLKTGLQYIPLDSQIEIAENVNDEDVLNVSSLSGSAIPSLLIDSPTSDSFSTNHLMPDHTCTLNEINIPIDVIYNDVPLAITTPNTDMSVNLGDILEDFNSTSNTIEMPPIFDDIPDSTNTTTELPQKFDEIPDIKQYVYFRF